MKHLIGQPSGIHIDRTVLLKGFNVLGQLILLQQGNIFTSNFQFHFAEVNCTPMLIQQVVSPTDVHGLTLDDIKSRIEYTIGNSHSEVLNAPCKNVFKAWIKHCTDLTQSKKKQVRPHCGTAVKDKPNQSFKKSNKGKSYFAVF